MAIPTFSEKYNEIKEEILERRSDINIQLGSVVSDTILVPIVLELIKEYIDSQYISNLQSLDLMQQMLNDTAFLNLVASAFNLPITEVENQIAIALENLVNNYGITRNPAIVASGIVQFCRTTLPTSDITVPINTIVATNSNIQYKTTTEVIMYTSLGSSYFDPDLLLYCVNVPVEAIEAGASGNAVVQSITTQIIPIVQLPIVTNKDAVIDGADEESNDDLIDRAKLLFLGNNLGTKDGYKKLILNNSDIVDLYVSDANDSFMVRDDGTGGDIDIYLLNRKLLTITETYLSAQEFQVLVKQPVISITNVSSGTYEFEKDGEDFESGYSGSILAEDRLHFSVLPTAPYTVVYTYDTNPETIQSLILQDENRILGSDVLIREGIQVNVDISMTITVVAGFTKSSVVAEVSAAIIAFVDTLKLGEDLQQSDIIGIVEGVNGVDRVIIPLTLFDYSGSVGVLDVIPAEAREFIRLANLVIL